MRAIQWLAADAVVHESFGMSGLAELVTAAHHLDDPLTPGTHAPSAVAPRAAEPAVWGGGAGLALGTLAGGSGARSRVHAKQPGTYTCFEQSTPLRSTSEPSQQGFDSSTSRFRC